jgi:hypothetical protein
MICLDEISVGSLLKPTYSGCNLGSRCVIKTTNQFVFRKKYIIILYNGFRKTSWFN